MLYFTRRPDNRASTPPMHYLDSADLLTRLSAQGHTRAEMAQITGLSIPQISERLNLAELDAGLRTLLRREDVPEKIATTLLLLPDPLSRRRLASRIVTERLCIRDATLLVGSARRHLPQGETVRQRVVTVIRDIRPYRNAIRSIAEQMQKAGVRAHFSERKNGSLLELTVSYPARRRRTERFSPAYRDTAEQFIPALSAAASGGRSFPIDAL